MSVADELRLPEVSYAAWRAEVERALKGADFEKRLVTRTLEGIAVQPLYTAADWPSTEDLGGFPGAPPYRRGALPIARHGEQRDARPRYDNPDPAALALELEADLSRGARSLWLAFDRQVRAGQARAELSRDERDRGVPCVSASQLGTLLAGVPLERVVVSLDAGGNALAVAACFLCEVARRGLDPARVEVWFNADPLAALARDGTLPFSLDDAREQLCALARFGLERLPRARSVTVSSVPYHDAGAHAAQELAYSLATGVTYLRWLEQAGIGVERGSAQLAFSVAVGSDFFMEIAKLRALRECWANVLAACGGDAEAQRCVIHATTSSRTKTLRDPYVNMLRETTEAFAASVGGADVITTAGFDRALGVSDSFARRIAGNVPVILDEEAQLSRVADPGGGAWYIEVLTDRLVEEAWRLFQAIEAEGGMSVALGRGSIASAVTKIANERETLIRKRKLAITGVSEFANVAEPALERKAAAWDAIARTRKLALDACSKDDDVTRPLAAARDAKHGELNAAIEVASRGANLEQLSRALAHSVEPTRAAAFPLRRDAAAFEALRAACDAAAQRGQRPGVFLCNLGPIPQHKPRAQFAFGFFSAGGFAVHDNDGFESSVAAAEAYARSGAPIAVLCGSDDAYASAVEEFTPRLRERGAKQVVLAGRGGEAEARYRAAGVSEFIFMGCDVVVTLERLLAGLGVK